MNRQRGEGDSTMVDLRTVSQLAIATLGSVALWGALTYLCRHFLLQWITSSVQHSFDVKLEEVRASNDRELKHLSSALDAQQSLVASAFLEARRASNERRLIAVQTVWDALMEFHREVPTVVATTDIVTTELYPKFFKAPAIQANIPSFLEVGTSITRSIVTSGLPVEKARLMCGEYLYALFFGYRALLGSIALDLAISSEKGAFQPWWNNEHILALLRSTLSPEEFEEFAGLHVGCYTWVTQNLERKFLLAAEEIIDGRRAATDAFDQARAILTAAKNLKVGEQTGPSVVKL
jgi:hypothetical protein